MATSTPARRESLVFPVVFIIVLFVGLAFVFQPQHVDVSLLPKVETATPVAVAAQPTPAIDTSELSFGMVLQMGLAEVNASSVKRGERIFSTTCTACHGYDAKGISGLGKPLIGSEFATALTDAQFVEFISVGRQPTDPLNTTGQMMPPRGGNPALSDDDLVAVVDYIRSLNGATVLHDIEQQTASTSEGFTPINVNSIDSSAVQPSGGASGTADLTQLEPVAFTAPDINALDPAVIHPSNTGDGTLEFATMSGQQAYNWSCAGCHGLDGQGIPALSTGSLAGVSGDTAALLKLFTEAVDPLSGFSHAFRGGFPALTDEQLQSVLDYIGTLAK